MDVLIRISQQLNNSTTPAFVPTAFQVSPKAAGANILFFLSLAFVLIDAFLAMLVKGWLQEFDQGWRKYTVAHLRAQERERRIQELERWKLHELVALLSILIQGSLLLFCVGLLVLIFPLHLPSAILFLVAFVSSVGFYGFTTYVSVVNKYSPFSSPVSRLLAHALKILQTWHLRITRNIRRIAPAISFHNHHSPPPQEHQAEADDSRETKQRVHWNDGMAKPEQPDNTDGVEKNKVAAISHSDMDPQTRVRVLERIVSTTAEAVENVPIFLELLDQPVRYLTLRPLNVEKWRELLHITLGLLRDRSIFSISAACTLARTMMICYNHETADQQLCLTLQHRLGSGKTDDQGARMPVNLLFSSYLPFWLGYSYRDDMWRTIAFLEPSDAADAELLWMVNTFHRTSQPEDLSRNFLKFFVAVLTYVSSTEQSRRSRVPLTAAVIYAMHNIRSALDRGINSIDGLYILPGTVSPSESVRMTFCQVDGVDALDLWSEECIQLVTDLLQWDWSADWDHDFQIALIAALYIDSTKQVHARSTFADIVRYTRITEIQLRFSDAYDNGKLAVYWYMAVFQTPLDHDRYPLGTLYDVIRSIIDEHSTLQLSGLHILEIAVKHVHKTASPSSHWLERWQVWLTVTAPGEAPGKALGVVDHWVLLHLETLLAPQHYLLPEEVKELEWPDTPEKVHIAKARLVLYDSLAEAEHQGSKGPIPDPELLRVFLWSNDHEVFTDTFKWCINLVCTGLPDILGDAESIRIFIPETLGYEWLEHFVHMLCNDAHTGGFIWQSLISHLIPKWNVLPLSWCCAFASAFLFSTVHPPNMNRLPAYQCLAEHIRFMPLDQQQAFLPFVETMLPLIKSSLTWSRLTSLEMWLAQCPEEPENPDAYTQIEHILVSWRQTLAEETLEFFAELPMAGGWTDDLQ
jgi:hypothetical protein